MKLLLVGWLAVLSSPAIAAGDECPSHVPREVEGLMLPVLHALRTAMDSGDWFAPRYEAAFEQLLQAKGDAAVEARVALMDYYVGEHFAEELVCASALDGPKARALLWRYESCDIVATLSPVRRDHALPLRGYAIAIIDSGDAIKRCTTAD